MSVRQMCRSSLRHLRHKSRLCLQCGRRLALPLTSCSGLEGSASNHRAKQEEGERAGEREKRTMVIIKGHMRGNFQHRGALLRANPRSRASPLTITDARLWRGHTETTERTLSVWGAAAGCSTPSTSPQRHENRRTQQRISGLKQLRVRGVAGFAGTTQRVVESRSLFATTHLRSTQKRSSRHW